MIPTRIFPQIHDARSDLLDLMIFSVATSLVSLCIQGVPKARFSTSLVCNTVRLDLVSKSWKQVVSFNLIHYSYLSCHLLTRIFDFCTSAPKVLGREYIFPPHIFCILYPELLELLHWFLWISQRINPIKSPNLFFSAAYSLKKLLFWGWSGSCIPGDKKDENGSSVYTLYPTPCRNDYRIWF